MATMDLTQMRQKAAATWALGDFGAVANAGTVMLGAELVRFGRIQRGERVLDIGTGTGAAALPAARVGARVTGIDITTRLLEEAKMNAALAGVEAEFKEADAQDLPFPDVSFDVVMSCVGHMFAPDHARTAQEMLRVLRPGGRMVTATWPPDGLVGEMFQLGARYVPPPPGVDPPLVWGLPDMMRRRFGPAMQDMLFEYRPMMVPYLSPAHYRMTMGKHFGPMVSFLMAMQERPEDLAMWQKEYDAMAGRYFEDNLLRHDALMMRGTKA